MKDLNKLSTLAMVGIPTGNPNGRPTVMTPDVLHKLEEAFAIGCSDGEACSYADISSSTFYNYQDAHPEFLERKAQLKERPILKAKNTIVKALDQPEHAKWYLERKKKVEFAQRTEQTGADGSPIVVLPMEIVAKNNLTTSDTPSSTEPDSDQQPPVQGS